MVARIIPEIGIKMLEKEGLDLTLWEEDRPMTPEELEARAKGHDILLSTITEKISKSFLAASPQIKMISQFAVGYDNIDIAAAYGCGDSCGVRAQRDDRGHGGYCLRPDDRHGQEDVLPPQNHP